MKGIKPNPVYEKVVLTVLQNSHRALVNNGVTTDKKDAATSDVIEKLVESCDDNSIKDVRYKEAASYLCLKNHKTLYSWINQGLIFSQEAFFLKTLKRIYFFNPTGFI